MNDEIITSYLLGKKAGGGGTPPVYEEKNVSITQNGDSTITAESGYDAISKVNLSVNVPQPSGKISITQNGTDIDVSSYASADVNVPTGATKIYDGTKMDLSTFTTAPTFDTSEMTNMTNLFSNCSNLVTIPVLNTSNVTTLSSTFYKCSSLKNIPQLDLSKVTSFSTTFSQCGLEEIDFSNTSFASGITSFNNAFSDCTSLEEVNLSTLGIVTGLRFDMSRMFAGCSSLKTVNLSNFDITNFRTANNMFNGCTSLEELDISSLTMPSSNFTSMFDNVPTNCLILVKDQTAKNWFTTNFPSLTNVQIKGA